MSNQTKGLSLRALTQGDSTAVESISDPASDPVKAAILETSMQDTNNNQASSRILKTSMLSSPVSPQTSPGSTTPAAPQQDSQLQRADSVENNKEPGEKHRSGAVSALSSAFKNLKLKFSNDSLRASSSDTIHSASSAKGSQTNLLPEPLVAPPKEQAQPATPVPQQQQQQQQQVEIPSASLPSSAPMAARPNDPALNHPFEQPALPITANIQPDAAVSVAGPQRITAATLVSWLSDTTDQPLIIDTRPPEDFEVVHLRDSFNAFAPPLIARRWMKNSGSMSAGAAQPGRRASLVPGGAGGGQKTINIETLVQPETARDDYRRSVSTAPRIAVMDDRDADAAAPGSVVFCIANELAGQKPQRLVAMVEGGWAAFLVICPRHLLQGPGVANLPPAGDLVGFAPAEDAGGFKRTTSFTLRTSNLRTSMRGRPSLSLAASGPPAVSSAGAADPASANTTNADSASTPASAPSALVSATGLPGARHRLTASNSSRPVVDLVHSVMKEEDESLASPLSPIRRGAPLPTSNPANHVVPSQQTQSNTLEADSDMAESPWTPEEAATPTCLDPSFIIDGLYLGPDLFGGNPQTAGSILQEINATAVLNMAFECIPPSEEQRRSANIQSYKQIATQDSADEKIELVLRDATSFIHDARAAGHTVYVHCKAGKSRSATVVIAYLMLNHGYSFDAAWAHVKAMRPAVAPNIGFFGLLRELNGKTLSALTPGPGSVIATPASSDSSHGSLSTQSANGEGAHRHEARPSHHAMP